MSYPQGRHLNNCSDHNQLDKRGLHYQEPHVTTQLQLNHGILGIYCAGNHSSYLAAVGSHAMHCSLYLKNPETSLGLDHVVAVC
jgi:hypothetical protein